MSPKTTAKILAVILCVQLRPLRVVAHDANGRSSAPIESRRLLNPVSVSEARLYSASANFARLCIDCHGEDGKSLTKRAGSMPYRPTDLTNYIMQAMKDGEIHWVITNGTEKGMPEFSQQLSEAQRWELVLWVRELRIRELYAERIQLGPYEWKLPPGFPRPKVPFDNLMTMEKVELGRHLFYDHRLSLNQKQSCATCHQQSRAFTDGRARGLGSTGELHPRGTMSLMNVAYSPVLTWANPNIQRLEQQVLIPLFGDHPVEMGMSGKEELLIHRLKAERRYQTLFSAAFPSEPEPVTIANVTKAIASFERTLLAGDSPYDEYRRGDDPNAISDSAKRGEGLFFNERLECFHCHGGFNFTGTIDYLGKGSAEIEFHNNGLYNLKQKLSYPEPNTGLYDFTRQPEDVGKFKAPTLRNIALTAPYMHDGRVKTLEDAIEHYAAGGRTIKSGPFAGSGSDNPNKSEFVKPFKLSVQEKRDLLSFLSSLSDPTIAANSEWSDPWNPPTQKFDAVRTKYVVVSTVAEVYPEAGSISLYHDEIPGFLDAAKAPSAREFLVLNKSDLAGLKPGSRIKAGIRKRGNDYALDRIYPARAAERSAPKR